MRFPRVTRLLLATLTIPALACSGGNGSSPILGSQLPLHLEDHVASAEVTGSEPPADPPTAVEWRFAEQQPAWKTAPPYRAEMAAANLTQVEDAVRVGLGDANAFVRPWDDRRLLMGGIYVDVPDWKLEDWSYVLVRVRASEAVKDIGLGFNLKEGPGKATDAPYPFRFFGEQVDAFNDGSVQTYLLRADWSGGNWEGPWEQLGLWFWADSAANVDVLSVQVIPKEADYSSEPWGVRAEVRDRAYRRALYTHAPGRIEFRIRVPEGARLDLGLGVLREDAPVTFRVSAGTDAGTARVLLEEAYADRQRWAQRSLDLSEFAGREVALTLEAESDREGTVALWAAPTLTGAAGDRRPNVIFYIIDGAGADYMSAYGYTRRTTPNIARLAAEGALFERAYSNASWTKPSTASFMTSLQLSVLGGLNWTDPVPEQATTMAEHFHRAGYQTGVFTANPNAGTLSGLERSVDVMKESWEEFTYFGGENYKESSRHLHEAFLDWRETYPGKPYWAHFQTTDIHEDFPAVAPFSGLFVGPQQKETWREWNDRLREAGGHGVYSDAYEKTGLNRPAFFALHQGMYDETMAHNDYQLGRLVERLKADGQWENTLLIIGSDHSTDAAMDDMGVAILDSLPPRWNQPMLRPSISRVPLIFVWPGHIAPGQRFEQPVSMIDVLPTVLDLVGLPAPEILQGQSLAPLLRGEEGWESRPVILDELVVNHPTGEYRGLLEVIDGRWGASLEINPDPDKEPEERRPVPLLVYDLWKDPSALQSLHEERPDLVERYTEFLEGQWEAHQILAQHFSRAEGVLLTAEQLSTLRALGYIQE
jgi:arylsulfatase A-like enzyme